MLLDTETFKKERKKSISSVYHFFYFWIAKGVKKREWERDQKVIMGNKIRIFLVTIPGPLLIAVNYKLCSQCRPTKEDIFKSQSEVIT